MGAGIHCPSCRGLNSHIYETRATENGTILRRRKCDCGVRFSTTEAYEGLVTTPGRKKAVKEESVPVAKTVPKPPRKSVGSRAIPRKPPKRRREDDFLEEGSGFHMDTAEALAELGLAARQVHGTRYGNT